ncbi:hypothetical protein ABMA28_007275 [Loxostege sticticalis]|uniref:Uncharacterized protein n=1 Tax=Loxostege sticticalis TaxID=481309 RepID=A0ABD0TQ34_LOXSC
MSYVKCNSCNIVIDELLSYIQNKVSISDEESLVRICSSVFTSVQIENSKKLLFEAVSSELKRKIRKGKGKENRELYDIISFFKATDPDVLPIFVARDLEKLPPITFDHLDVSKTVTGTDGLTCPPKHGIISYRTIRLIQACKCPNQTGNHHTNQFLNLCCPIWESKPEPRVKRSALTTRTRRRLKNSNLNYSKQVSVKRFLRGNLKAERNEK